MCGIFGALLKLGCEQDRQEAETIANFVFEASHRRGRDGRGWVTRNEDGRIQNGDVSTVEVEIETDSSVYLRGDTTTMIGNTRAEPTTEFVKTKKLDDQQPYTLRDWSIVHNGTIANDKELRTNEYPSKIDSAAIVERLAHAPFHMMVKELKGSFAILATSSMRERSGIYFACNYRPIWYIETYLGVFFASARDYFPADYLGKARMIDPYSYGTMDYDDEGVLHIRSQKITKVSPNARALVVCSGGLDSVVAAADMKAQGYEIELIHFQYGSRAEGPEVKAVQAVAQALGCPCTLFPLPVYKPSDSKLLQADASVAGGEEGAEFAHEWVPARNLLLLSVATAYAEANGFQTIVLGNNLEEAGAYPDNEPEFIDRFNDILPFAVGTNASVQVVMPVGNMMKHEIVALGLMLGAPLHLTWSCYRAGALHCGKCGPCFMRKTAFEINQEEEVIEYDVSSN